jgi:hypothetical protein
MGRFRATLAPHGSPADQLHNHLQAVRALFAKERQVGAVMGELALRSSRDESIAAIMRETNEAWHGTLRGLLSRAAEHGHLRPDVDSDEAAAVIMAVLMTLALPTMSGSALPDRALAQLERWLGLE